ncbi:FixH family protein [Aliifodinibius sp. S!AR15-10]|uniref:FixH family protein n=1 Tax=Aliifodinibius sp. S!AR15-10 TaxID=2950437 RepID=UPI002856F29C|nr:FixH family protein [Aliifodinibius sp. S!AR15-10]MDR8391678.1 FixH family protein [Aliifodinibius sp. S!AR15-10]
MFLLLCFTIAGCQSSVDDHSDVKLNWEIEPDPPSVGMATIDITLRDSTQQLLTGAKVKLEGTMSHPGMKPIQATAEEVEPGHYSAEMEFTMGGDWILLVTSTLPDDRIVERQIKIPGVRSE